MPWNSSYGMDMQSACREIPGTARDDQGYSTPDVYGRAVQLYLALERAAQDQDFNCEPVVMWRALLTMLALRNMLDLPLVWTYVQIASGDPLSNALSYPPKDNNQLLYPDMEEYQWDGTSFYVLTWAPDGQDPIELALYSPMTLIYPVADWRKVFAKIPQMSKFFKVGTFKVWRECIQGGEMNFVYPWLRDMEKHLSENTGTSTAKNNILLHLRKFMAELASEDKSLAAKKLPLTPAQFGYTALLSNLVPQMVTAYDIGGPVFSDQLCVLRVGKGENPFAPCDYSENYRIQGGPLEQDVDLYAFLPIHPGRRDKCRENGLAESVTMRLRSEREGATLKHYVHASASTTELPGITLSKDYLLVEEGESAEKNTAVYYKDLYNRNVVLTKDTWPLFSVWPTTLDANWKQYYVMRSDERECLRLKGERGTSDYQPDGNDVVQGDNNWVVQTSYVPDAIPLVRVLSDESGRLTDQSMDVGMVTPKRGLSVKGTGGAIVAVDFGTSSTRVFYTLAGNNQPVNEILVAHDKPLQVTEYEGSVARQLEMGTYFIAPVDAKESDNTLFSIFRRSEDKNRMEVHPMLDGAIYQPNGQVMPDDTQFLVTDLKWNGTIARPYYIAFMKQLCLHIMTYLYKKYQVGAIEWHYALPRALDETNQSSMNKIWQEEVLGFLNKVSDNVILHHVTTPSPADNRLPLLTESIAASRYFDKYRGREINPNKGYLVVDIGGGSTDAALWQRDRSGPTKLKWHASVLVAGRRMFTRWIEQNIDNLTVGVNDDDTRSLLETINEGNFSNHQDKGAKEALVDRLLTTHSREILANYNTNITTHANDWGTSLRDKITQSVALLLFSLGYQVGALMNPENRAYPENMDASVENEKQTPRFQVPPGPGYFTIAFGGRGSKVLDWLSCGIPVLTGFFKDGVAAAGSTWPNVAITIITSEDPKCEVALGLLVSVPQGSPTGWENVGNKEMMQDPYYFADDYYANASDEQDYQSTVKRGAASTFYESFRKAFPTSYDMRDLSDPSSQNELATAASRSMGAEPALDDAFKVLMESIYAVLED